MSHKGSALVRLVIFFFLALLLTESGVAATINTRSLTSRKSKQTVSESQRADQGQRAAKIRSSHDPRLIFPPAMVRARARQKWVPLSFFLRLKFQRGRVHTVSQAGGRRSVLEDVSEVCVAAGATDFGPSHSVTDVAVLVNTLWIHW